MGRGGGGVGHGVLEACLQEISIGDVTRTAGVAYRGGRGRA